MVTDGEKRQIITKRQEEELIANKTKGYIKLKKVENKMLQKMRKIEKEIKIIS